MAAVAAVAAVAQDKKIEVLTELLVAVAVAVEQDSLLVMEEMVENREKRDILTAAMVATVILPIMAAAVVVVIMERVKHKVGMAVLEEILVKMVILVVMVKAMMVKAMAATAVSVVIGYAQEETKFKLVDGREQNKVNYQVGA